MRESAYRLCPGVGNTEPPHDLRRACCLRSCRARTAARGVALAPPRAARAPVESAGGAAGGGANAAGAAGPELRDDAGAGSHRCRGGGRCRPLASGPDAQSAEHAGPDVERSGAGAVAQRRQRNAAFATRTAAHRAPRHRLSRPGRRAVAVPAGPLRHDPARGAEPGGRICLQRRAAQRRAQLFAQLLRPASRRLWRRGHRPVRAAVIGRRSGRRPGGDVFTGGAPGRRARGRSATRTRVELRRERRRPTGPRGHGAWRRGLPRRARRRRRGSRADAASRQRRRPSAPDPQPQPGAGRRPVDRAVCVGDAAGA